MKKANMIFRATTTISGQGKDGKWRAMPTVKAQGNTDLIVKTLSVGLAKLEKKEIGREVKK